jgi:hypothetical protein
MKPCRHEGEIQTWYDQGRKKWIGHCVRCGEHGYMDSEFMRISELVVRHHWTQGISLGILKAQPCRPNDLRHRTRTAPKRSKRIEKRSPLIPHAVHRTAPTFAVS